MGTEHRCAHNDAHQLLAEIELINERINRAFDGLHSESGWRQEFVIDLLFDLVYCADEIDVVQNGALFCDELRAELGPTYLPDDTDLLANIAYDRLPQPLQEQIDAHGIREVRKAMRRTGVGRFGSVMPG